MKIKFKEAGIILLAIHITNRRGMGYKNSGLFQNSSKILPVI